MRALTYCDLHKIQREDMLEVVEHLISDVLLSYRNCVGKGNSVFLVMSGIILLFMLRFEAG